MIPLYKPFMPDFEISELQEVLYSNELSYGKFGVQFEEKLKNFIGCNYLLTVNTYNMAMLVLISTLGLKPGDEIIASPVSCLASNQPFATKSLKIIWADVHPETGLLSPEDVESKVTKRTRAIFHNHFCGYIGDIQAINKIGEKYGISVIDDGIEAFGSEYRGKKIGNVGTDYTVFSFQTVRLPNTIDGGAIVFKNREMYERALLIRDYGIDRTKFRKKDGEINPDCDVQIEGYGGLMNELNSFIGINQMLSIEKLVETQRRNAKVWKNELLKNSDIKPLPVDLIDNPNYWVFGVLANNVLKAKADFAYKGFATSGVHLNNNLYSVFGNKSCLKGVEIFKKQFLAIPCGWWVSK